ncbi:c-type cytochrome [Caenimonas terrae]|uniref:C-type cytochrome n=1 Tax=Caenimonas terrae TaxID=696074 RepID=A0ABW0NIS2_9BURK
MNKSKPVFLQALAAAALLGALGAPALSHAADAAAAEALARQQNCLKCHSIDKKKDGPSFKEVAAKYKGKSDAEQRLITHITSGEKAKFPDGHEEEHKIIKASAGDTKNLIQWILSL